MVVLYLDGWLAGLLIFQMIRDCLDIKIWASQLVAAHHTILHNYISSILAGILFDYSR